MRKPLAAGLFATLLPAAGLPAAAQQVTLPLVQFEELRSRANPAPEAAEPPPAPFALESDEIDITPGPVSARVVQTLTLTLYTAERQSIPLGDAGSFVHADLGGLEGRVDAAGSGSLEVKGAGRHTVRLESVVPVDRDAVATRPSWTFVLHPPAAALVRGTLRAAPELGPQIEEVVAGATALLHHTVPGIPGAAGVVGVPGAVGVPGPSWSFVALPGKALEWKLLGKAVLPERARLPLRFEVTSATATTLSRTQLQVRGWLEARVAQGRLPELRLPLPPGFKVVGVSGPIAGWKLTGA
ncbi:MAG: hypothetical protein M3O15_07110, partial [Acidobacteriota bacterium]|nr:hypothetical protein [Acidobacteriota bacterium]